MARLILNAQNNAYTVNGDSLSVEMSSQAKAGTAPLSLWSYLNEALTGLKQYGKCTQASTPTPTVPVDIKCNNGVIKYGKPLTLDSTRIKAYIRDGGLWVNSSDSYSIVVPVTIGKKYAIRLTNTASGTVGTIFRYGFSARDTAGDTTTNLVQLTQWVRSTPQDISFVELTADNPYLIIQMGASLFESNITNGYIIVTEQTVWADGTPEVLKINDDNYITRTGETEGKIINVRGVVSDNSSYCISAPFSLPQGHITCTWDVGQGSRPFSVWKCDANGNVIADGNLCYVSTSVTGINTVEFDTDAPTLAIACYRNNATDLTAKLTPKVADLLQAGTYKDEQDIISGLITRQLKIKILDGTENWSAKDANGRSAITLNPQPAVTNLVRRLPFWCSHFQVLQNGESASALHSGVCYFYNAGLYFHYDQADVTAFKAWLAELYAAGTPVIVIYPVADYTEQVTPQPLSVIAGQNTVSAVAEVTPIDLQATYLTI